MDNITNAIYVKTCFILDTEVLVAVLTHSEGNQHGSITCRDTSLKSLFRRVL